MSNDRQKVTISGLGSFLPGNPIENRYLSQTFNINEEWINYFIGNRRRHLAINLENHEVTYTLAEMCTNAAKRAIQNSDYLLKDIEFIVMATATPDHLIPSTINLVADKLGINFIPTYQLQSGCTGAIQALEIAQQFLLSNNYQVGLVIGGDVCNKYMHMNRDFSQMSSKELMNYVLFADGAGAAVLTSEKQASGLVIESILNQLTGLNIEPGQIINCYSDSINSFYRPQAITEDYKKIEKKVPIMSKEILYQLSEKMQWDLDSIDYIMPPQLSENMTQHIIKIMDFPKQKAINCISETGNNGNALSFLQLQLLDPLMQKGQKALGVAVESSKWIKSGLALSRT